MHFYYLDEAGCTGVDLENEEQPIFVLGGISVRDEGWNATQERLARLISAYFEGAVPGGFELHAEELLSPDGDGPFAGHARNRRNELAQSVLRLLDERRHDVHLIGLDKAKLRTTHHPRYQAGVSQGSGDHNFQQTIRGCRRTSGKVDSRVQLPRDSHKNPMVQLSDLVVYCSKKFLELEGGYRDNWPDAAKRFYAECFGLIDSRNPRKALVERAGRGMEGLNTYLERVRATYALRWRKKYALE